MQDRDDTIIDRALARLSAKAPRKGLVADIVSMATALPQEKPPVAFVFSLDNILSLHLLGLQQKALVLGVVALAAFGSGMLQGYHQVSVSDPSSALFEDDDGFDDMEGS